MKHARMQLPKKLGGVQQAGMEGTWYGGGVCVCVCVCVGVCG